MYSNWNSQYMPNTSINTSSPLISYAFPQGQQDPSNNFIPFTQQNSTSYAFPQGQQHPSNNFIPFITQQNSTSFAQPTLSTSYMQGIAPMADDFCEINSTQEPQTLMSNNKKNSLLNLNNDNEKIKQETVTNMCDIMYPHIGNMSVAEWNAKSLDDKVSIIKEMAKNITDKYEITTGKTMITHLLWDTVEKLIDDRITIYDFCNSLYDRPECTLFRSYYMK